MSVDRQASTSNENGVGAVLERMVDARVAWLLMGEGRTRLTGRLFGVPRRDSRLLALIGLVALADTLGRRARRMRKPVRPPTLTETIVGAAGVKEAAHRLMGPSSREVDDFGTVVSVIVVAAMIRPVLGPPIRSARRASRRARATVGNIFGGLIGHPRVRAVVAATKAASPVGGGAK
jgi:hypothetical protein